MSRKLLKFTELPFREKLLFLEAFLLHLWVGLLLTIIPFSWIPRLFSNPEHGMSAKATSVIDNGSQKGKTDSLSPATDSFVLNQIKSATSRASKSSPWKNKCLISSLAARCMLRRRHISSQLSLGVARSGDGRVIAHAWLKSGDCELVPQNGEFTALFLF
ncbi:MAG: lasso peptide biosynthesis B2 protein [Bacteroidales bacterium]|jgi:hypothetical protein|nr:lasso peptide biosynthesis B2 protein [Bacteroidales bacterium]